MAKTCWPKSLIGDLQRICGRHWNLAPQKDMFLNIMFQILHQSKISHFAISCLTSLYLIALWYPNRNKLLRWDAKGTQALVDWVFLTHHGAGCVAFPRSVVEELYPRYFQSLRNHIVNRWWWVRRHEWLSSEPKTCMTCTRSSSKNQLVEVVRQTVPGIKPWTAEFVLSLWYLPNAIRFHQLTEQCIGSTASTTIDLDRI